MMKKALWLACCLACVPAWSAVAAVDAPAPAQVDARLNAEQVVERNIAARGGLAAWRAVKTLRLAGQMEAGGKENGSLPFVMQMKRDHKSRLEIEFQHRNAVQVYDGKQGWKVRPFLNRDEVEAFTPDEARKAAATDELDGPLVDHESKGIKVELAGSDTINGRSNYRLRLVQPGGRQRLLWIDASTFLETRIEGEPRTIDGVPRKVYVYYQDFRKEQGLTTPRALETVVQGIKESQSHKMSIAKVVVNEDMADALFQKPVLNGKQAAAN